MVFIGKAESQHAAFIRFEVLDKTQRPICKIVGPDLVSNLQSLSDKTCRGHALSILKVLPRQVFRWITQGMKLSMA